MKLHHVGYLVKRIDAARRAFEALGYEAFSLCGAEAVCYDASRQCNICFLKLPEQAGLEGLEKALSLRFYENINETAFLRGEGTLIYQNVDCFVQRARERKGMLFHPCKSVGNIEYAEFARVIDPRIRCECVSCYPEITDETCCCAWKFTLAPQAE